MAEEVSAITELCSAVDKAEYRYGSGLIVLVSQAYYGAMLEELAKYGLTPPLEIKNLGDMARQYLTFSGYRLFVTPELGGADYHIAQILDLEGDRRCK